MNRLTTPCYILDIEELNRSISGFKTALNSHFVSSIIGYSVKTNSLPYCLSYAKQYGCYAEVVSHDEYELALLCGYAKNNIIYNGPMKSKETFLDAITNGAIVNIETKRELEWLKELPTNDSFGIGIRININVSKISPSDALNENDYGRFGFSDETDELKNALSQIDDIPNVYLSGLHIHRSPHTRSVSFYKETTRYAANIIKKYDLKLNYIDIGGGFYGIFKDNPTYADYCSAIKASLAEYDLGYLMVIVEPGMAILGSAFSFLTKVIDIKNLEPDLYIVTTDGSRNDIDPLFKKESYLYEIISDSNHPSIVAQQVICGCSCIEFDRLFALKNHFLLNENDFIKYKNVGAYTMCLSPLFIRYFPDVYIKKGDEYNIVRKSWTATEYIQNSLI